MAISSAFTLAASYGSHQHRHHEFKGRKINDLQKWRRGWDSNPRYGFPYARFRGEYFQPLSHLSAVVADLIVAERCVFRQSGGTLCQRVGKYRPESMQCYGTAGASRKSQMHRPKPATRGGQRRKTG